MILLDETEEKLHMAKVQREYWRNLYYMLQNKYEGTEVPIKEDYWNLEENKDAKEITSQRHRGRHPRS